MNLARAGAMIVRQYYLFRGSPARIISQFTWIGIDILLWGFITRYLNSMASPGFDFVPSLLGAVLLWDFFTRVKQGVTMAFFEDVWSRNFLNIFASPMSVAEYIGGLVLLSVCTSAAALFFMLALAITVFGFSFFMYGAAALPFLVVLFLFGIAIGVMATALLLRLGPAAEWLVWPIPALIAPFAAVFYPLSTLPEWMRVIAAGLPPSYVFEGLRQIVAGRGVSAASLVIGAVIAVIYVAGACWIFMRTYRHAVRTGLIGRYSAETLS